MSIDITSITLKNVNTSDGELIITWLPECVFQIPIAELKCVAQICYGDSFMGAAPGSIWIFVGSEKSLVVSGEYFHAWYTLEPGLFEYHQTVERLEAFVANPPEKFSKLHWLLKWAPALAKPVTQEIATSAAKQFLKEVSAKKVDAFSVWD